MKMLKLSKIISEELKANDLNSIKGGLNNQSATEAIPNCFFCNPTEAEDPILSGGARAKSDSR